MQGAEADITTRVRMQYEEFPYPDYSLFIPLRTQEAYASNSLFAARLLEQSGQKPIIRQNGNAEVLLAGCGDIFPYMATFWEPRRHHLTAVDLSSNNLKRARLRSLFRWRAVDWQQGNLEDRSFPLPAGLSHIDSYGVLHHLANPRQVLDRFQRHLSAGGTARIMVYNSDARHWIRHIQKAFALLGLSAFDRHDLDRAQSLLEQIAVHSPTLRGRFAPMRQSIFSHSSRFVDTFFHAREARLNLKFWLDAIQGSGLRCIGLFDRYAELDDLPNPLLKVPSYEDWQARIDDRRFENNFELFLAKDAPAKRSDSPGTTRRLPARHHLKTPPQSWFAYQETRSLPWLMRRRLWLNFLQRLTGRPAKPMDAWAAGLPPETLQRLARIGALFPDDMRSYELKGLLLKPMHDQMEAPEFPEQASLGDRKDLRSAVDGILLSKSLPLSRSEQILKRLDAAQAP